MINDAIAKFLEEKHLAVNTVKIEFKNRGSRLGFFLKAKDYEELKAKNFWRIVLGDNIEIWKKNNDANLAKIFHGTDILKLAEVKIKKVV